MSTEASNNGPDQNICLHTYATRTVDCLLKTVKFSKSVQYEISLCTANIHIYNIFTKSVQHSDGHMKITLPYLLCR